MPDILGRIDLIVETDEALKIIDLKTARTRWSTEQAERSGEQLLLYAALAKDLVPGKPIQLEFAVVTKTASPVVEALRSRGTQPDRPHPARDGEGLVRHRSRKFLSRTVADGLPDVPISYRVRSLAGLTAVT